MQPVRRLMQVAIGVVWAMPFAACHSESPGQSNGAASGGTGSAGRATQNDSGVQESGAAGGPTRVSDAGAAGAGASDGGVASANDAGDRGYVRAEPVAYPPMPVTDISALLDELPKNAEGRPVLLADNEGNSLVVEPDDDPGPLSAMTQCVTILSWCTDHEGKMAKSLDACWISVPPCKTKTPWQESTACCPSSCVAAYEAARQAGLEPVAADRQVLFKKPRCVAGLDEELGEQP